MATLSPKLTITVDGNFSDWVSSELITMPANAVPGYSLYGTVQNDTYFIGIDATLGDRPGDRRRHHHSGSTRTRTRPPGTVRSAASAPTTTSPMSMPRRAFYLYTGAAAQTLVSATPLTPHCRPMARASRSPYRAAC